VECGKDTDEMWDRRGLSEAVLSFIKTIMTREDREISCRQPLGICRAIYVLHRHSYQSA
jgi:hypothetical protein